MRQVRAQIRGAALFGRRAVERSRRLRYGELLILRRGPANWIQVLETTSKPVGFVAQEVAADLAPRMDNEIWLAGVLIASTTIFRAGRPRITYPVALLWRRTPRIIERDYDEIWQDAG
jgi:hypothetical protein